MAAVTDLWDRATEREEEIRADALAEARYRRERERSRPSAVECRVCGGRIPVKRRRAVPGVQTCVHCQEELEEGLL
jgi:phage/conjugal plasmid C-4 type zinc finger TraR family protein